MSSERENEGAQGEPSSGKIYPLDWETLPKAMLDFEERLTVFRTRVPGVGWSMQSTSDDRPA